MENNKIKMGNLILKASMISRRLILASVCATTVCLTSCGDGGREEHRAAVEKKHSEVPTISWEDHINAVEGHGVWLGFEEYITYPEGFKACLRPRLYRWNHRVNKYVITRWAH